MFLIINQLNKPDIHVHVCVNTDIIYHITGDDIPSDDIPSDIHDTYMTQTSLSISYMT